MNISKLLITLTLTVQAIAFTPYNPGGCLSDPEIIQDKIDTLKQQVYCSNAGSLSSCLDLIHNEQEPSSDYFDLPETISCESTMPPTTVASAVLRTQIDNIRAVASELEGRRYVNDAADFYQHMKMHKERISALGLQLLKEFPEEFSGLDEATVKRVLSVHDDAKVTLGSRFNGKPFYQVLYEEGYGKRLDRSVVDALNEVDGKFTEDALRRVGLSLEGHSSEALERVKKTRELILKVEKIADFVDRGMSPVSSEEFGRAVSRASENDFFLKTEEERAMAKLLEDKYDTITKGLEYKKLSLAEKTRLVTRLEIGARYGSLNSTKAARAAISARAIASQVKSSSKRAASLGLKVLSNARFANALMGVELMLHSEATACATIGYHDWVQDPECKPVLALSPQVISFLGEDWDRQQEALSNGQHMCTVVENIFDDLQSKRFTKLKCKDNGDVEVRGVAGKSLRLTKGTNGEIAGVDFINLAHRGRTSHKVKSVKLNTDGKIIYICYESRHHAKGRSKEIEICFNEEQIQSEELTSFRQQQLKAIQEYINTNSFDLARSSLCCDPTQRDERLRQFCGN